MPTAYAMIGASIAISLVILVSADVLMFEAYRQGQYRWMVFQGVIAAINCATLVADGWLIVRITATERALRRTRRLRDDQLH